VSSCFCFKLVQSGFDNVHQTLGVRPETVVAEPDGLRLPNLSPASISRRTKSFGLASRRKAGVVSRLEPASPNHHEQYSTRGDLVLQDSCKVMAGRYDYA
jgi:hypothetical protein